MSNFGSCLAKYYCIKIVGLKCIAPDNIMKNSLEILRLKNNAVSDTPPKTK